VQPFVWDSRADGVGLASIATGVLVEASVIDGVALFPGTCQSAPFDVDNTQLCSGICGDCNLSMVGPDIIDALTAAQISAGLVMAGPVQTACCDVNTSMAVDILDSLLIAQAAAGLPAVLMCL
jgi:hypothetical protein